jgi:hypothetical protein
MDWTSAFKLGASMWANGVTAVETLLAANNVVSKRGQTIDAAIRDPFGADLEELGTMVSEKIAAFSHAGSAIARNLSAIRDDMLAQNRDILRLFLHGWPPDFAAAGRITARASRLVLRMSIAGGRAMAPIHAAATANDRRLRRAR